MTYGLDLPSEERLTRWLDAAARGGPLSLLTEDAGWRHRGPGAGGRPTALEGFDHGGPRIAVDPVDGTRNLMGDLRSAWTVIAYAPPGAGPPRLSEVTAGVLSEIPGSLAGAFRTFHARAGGRCELALRRVAGGEPIESRTLAADPADDRPDHGYLPFFRYDPAQRPSLARIEAAFFARLAEREGADPLACYDDQYISNGGQLALLGLGTYRMIADLRAFLAAREGEPATTSKPYDLAGAVLCARAAGCVLTDPEGGELDFPLDAHTPVSFVGYANAATRARLEPHLRAVLG